MKKLIISFVILLILKPGLDAQQADNGFLLSGRVIYQEIAKMDIQLEGMDSQLAARLPKERKSEKILYFTENEAVFQNKKDEDPEVPVPMEEGGIMIKMSEPDNLTYMDLVKKELIEQKEFMSRVFLIESDLVPHKWKMTGQQRRILEYSCQEATSVSDGYEIHAWFTPQIEVSAGPGAYSGLPGLILAVEMDGGDRKLEALEVELMPLDKSLLERPSKGKKVSGEEYQAIVTEKLKEMGMEGDGTWNSDGGAQHTSTVVIQIEQ